MAAHIADRYRSAMCLAAKAGCYAVSRTVSHELSPIQLGVLVKGGAEAAVHAVQSFITNKSTQTTLRS